MITKRDFQIMCKISKRCYWLAPTECYGCWYRNFCDNFAKKPKDWRLEDLKPNIISKDEYIILKNLNDDYKELYIVRENEMLNFYIKKPIKKYDIKNMVVPFNYFKNIFKTIIEGEEPRKIIDYIKEYELWEEKKNENKKE